ncbi:hypothetical protein BH18ACT1_BH18ACT1_19090 [soil metagenome]
MLAVEPAVAMIAQRPPGAAPAIRAVAEVLPFPDGAFDAALAVLTLHHWSDLPRAWPSCDGWLGARWSSSSTRR